MTKKEYIKQQELIESSYGKPSWDVNGMPLNESAKKLLELKQAFDKAVNQMDKLKQLKDQAKEAKEIAAIEIQDYLVRPEWMISFSEDEKRVVLQWITNTKQTPKEMAVLLDLPLSKVKAVLGLEAFKVFREHVNRAYLSSLQTEAIAALHSLLSGRNESIKFNVAQLILSEANILSRTIRSDNTVESTLLPEDPKTWEELGNELRRLKKEGNK